MALTKISSNVIANNTIAVGNIADNSVDATKIASNSILTRHIDDNQIGIDQLNVSDGSNGQMLTTNGSGTLSFSTPSSFDADAAQVFNESGAAVDFRIEGDTEQNLFFVDGSADKIGIGTSSPAAILDVQLTGAGDAVKITGNSVTDFDFIGDPPEFNLEDSGSTSGQKRARLTLNDQQLKIQGLSDADDAVTSSFITCDLSNGNVGIGGSSTPAQAFEIYRNSSSGSAGGYAGLSLRNDHSSGYMALQFHEGGTLRADILMQNGTNDMQFRVGGSGTERMRILSGGGLTFNGDTATANALDDYEEGDFTPIFATAGGSAPTSQTGTGQYTKIGDVVHLTGQISWSGSGSGGVNLRIALPFNLISDARAGMAIGLNSGVSYTSGHMLHLIPEINTNVIYLVSSPADGSGHDHLNFSNVKSTGSTLFSFSGSFHTRD